MRKNPRWRIALTTLIVLSLLWFSVTAFMGTPNSTAPAPIPSTLSIPLKSHT